MLFETFFETMESELESKLLTVSEIKLSYLPLVKPSERPRVVNHYDAYQLFLSTWDMTKIELYEQFKVMLLNRTNRVLGICTLTSGTSTATFMDPKQIFGVALKANAVELILAHNHPSGSLTPSTQDCESTKKVKLIGDYLGLKVLDHLIITAEGSYSFANEGII